MKKFFSLFAFFLFATLTQSFAGDRTSNWTVSAENPKVFIQNQGQFHLPSTLGNESVLYAFDNGASVIYFTKTGVTYSLKKNN